ncbi:CBS domain-containing protein [Mariprofundus erugo]|nr:CBS domain-containing protein [Mariprofundus erugo]
MRMGGGGAGMLENRVGHIFNRHVVRVTPDTPVAEAIRAMADMQSTSIVICGARGPVGILTARDLPRLYEHHTDLSAPIQQVMTSPVTTCLQDISLLDALDIMLDKGIRHIPVVNSRDELEGMISESDIMDSLGSADLMHSQTIIQIMKSEVITISSQASFDEVMEIFLAERIGSLIVTRDSLPVGIITERDLPRLISSQTESSTTAEKIMTAPVITISVHATAQDALLKMHATHIHHLLVTDTANRIKGIITRSCFFHDLGRYLIRKLVMAERQVRVLSQLQQEQQLPAIENFYLQATENAPYAMLVYKLGTIIYANKAAMQMFAYKRRCDLIGRLITDVLRIDAFSSELDKLLTHENDISNEIIRLAKDDGSAWIAEISSAVIVYEGEPATLLTLKDITEQKALEDRLNHAQKMEAIGTLAGGIAHDFNNMLAGITGNIFLLKRQTDDHPGMRKKFSDIENLCFKAAELVAQMLTFSRKTEIDTKPIAMVPFVKETLKLARVAIPENIHLQSVVSPEQLTVRGNTTQLHQVMINLLNNARDALAATPHPLIRVELQPFTPDERFQRKFNHMNLAPAYVHLSITDNGSGIAAADLNKIFEPFFTTKSEGKGTGLGLAMVYGAIQSHQGLIDVESSQDTGSTFHIYLPQLQATASEPMLADHSQIVEGHGEWILLVDDDSRVLGATRDVIESMGYHVITAENGEMAIARFIAHIDQIRLIISDVVMPVMGGIESVTQIQKIKPVPALFTTGYGLNQSCMHDGSLLPGEVITKPVHPSTLSQHIRELLDGIRLSL